ncbi:MAG: hypothetical protein K8F91_25575 [Candidatus Obscuribacterales bacterium]|nr:hypothetical protein [Candidatus Obscuribacterales bacterium]
MSGKNAKSQQNDEHFSELEQYDLSFAYSFNWERPEKQIREALRVLLCNRDSDNNSESGDAKSIDMTKTMTNTKANTSKESEARRQALRESAALEAARIRWLLAINPNTPPPVLDHLTRNAPSALLERIAEHPRAHSTTLARLAVHEDAQVRAAVAENMNTSMKTIWKLIRDDSPDVRLRIAESYTVPIAVLKTLVEDENPYVCHRAQSTLLRLMREVTELRTA